MVRRNTNKDTYRHETNRAIYLVTLERIKNTTNGTPRYSANIITLEVKGEPHNGIFYYTANYTFTGTYAGELKEIEYIVNQYEQELAKEAKA